MRKFVSLCLLLMGWSTAGFAFTQSGLGIQSAQNAMPMGHEWLTRMSALELIGGDPIAKPDPNDPRKQWTDGKAKNLTLGDAAKREVIRIKSQSIVDDRYESTYADIFATIIGERWVDIAGFNVTNTLIPKNIDCFSAVSQEPVAIQRDHFMRRYDDEGGQGGVDAAIRSQKRFIEHFVNAAIAPSKNMKVWDGGGYAAQVKVNSNYFLFGRALHLFQDAFSPEHTVRMAEDNYERVRQVKSYLCSKGSEQHSHAKLDIFSYVSGDVIWKVGTQLQGGWASYKPSNMKDIGLVASEASKDLWAAFIRSMATPMGQREKVARSEAQTLVNNWLSFETQEMLTWYDNENYRIESYVLADGETGRGITQAECMKGLGVASGKQMDKVKALEHDQRMCLYNIKPVPGYEDLHDPYLHIPYNWQWKSSTRWLTPPADWKIPQVSADTGKAVTIKNIANGRSMVAPDGLVDNAWIYNHPGPAVKFLMVGDPAKSVYFRAQDNADLFLSYRLSTGAVKLYSSSADARYSISKVGNNQSIFNLRWRNYMWLNQNTESPYVSGQGNPDNAEAQWKIEGQ